ncbi:hypothetical protein KQI63_08870 [bacterium]|nr:hypothetical protein [bacterium]
MAKLGWRQLAIKVIEEVGYPLTGAEIWEYAVEKGLDKLSTLQGKTPDATIISTLYWETKHKPDETEFFRIGSRPTRFFVKSLNLPPKWQSTIEKKIEQKTEQQLPKERELHKYLSQFAYFRFPVYTKTIRHEKSKKGHSRKENQWLHPDLIGAQFFFESWHPSISQLAQVTGSEVVRFYSFEMKRSLSFGNLRESFFQAVSNSSWAHEGYLVAASISNEPEFQSELERLSTAFGIGVILLDIEDRDASRVLYPARPKNEIDWDTLNKLADLNSDVSDFLNRVSNDMKIQEVRLDGYDKIEGS